MKELKNPKPKVVWSPLNGNQFYPVNEVKNNIFLHHTAGNSAKDAIEWWNQTPEHVGTPFVIDRDGTIYQCYDEKQWAYSLSVKGASKTEEHGIPIELVSLGFLFDINPAKGEHTYVAYPLWPLKREITHVKEDEVINVEFKGYHYWQKYTEPQIISLISLMKYLVEAYDIPVQDDLVNFFGYNVKVATQNIPGIWSHTTVRQDKYDIFPQPNLLEALFRAFGKSKK